MGRQQKLPSERLTRSSSFHIKHIQNLLAKISCSLRHFIKWVWLVILNGEDDKKISWLGEIRVYFPLDLVNTMGPGFNLKVKRIAEHMRFSVKPETLLLIAFWCPIHRQA